MAGLNTPMLDAFKYIESEVMRKKLIVFADIEKIIKVMISIACNVQMKEVRLGLPLGRNWTCLRA